MSGAGDWTDRKPPASGSTFADLELDFTHDWFRGKVHQFRTWPEGTAFRLTLNYEPVYLPRLQVDRHAASPMFSEEGWSEEILFRTVLTTEDGRVFASALEDFTAERDHVELRLLDAEGDDVSDWVDYWAPGLNLVALRLVHLVWPLAGLDVRLDLDQAPHQ